MIHVVDSTTIQLIVSCMDWANHRRRKAAAKLYMRLNLQNFLPKFAIVDTASHNDNRRARELCAGFGEGEIVVFAKVYHLWDLTQRGIFWITRAKENVNYRCIKRSLRHPEGRLLRDDEIIVSTPATHPLYPGHLRLARAIVECDGKKVEMVFLTNNFDWLPATIADLYKHRWSIEAFFKQNKQTLQLCDFLGPSKSAIQWQV